MRPLEPTQIRRVIAFLEDEWVDEDDASATERALAASLSAMDSPLELHFCALGFDWDTGVDALTRIIEHPLCDRGTALAIFWYGAPDFHYGKPRAKLRDYERVVRDLLELIERRTAERSFATEEIRFDPTRARDKDLTAHAREPHADRAIPAVMFEPSPGELPAVPARLVPYVGRSPD
jgi:hypothetical protein